MSLDAPPTLPRETEDTPEQACSEETAAPQLGSAAIAEQPAADPTEASAEALVADSFAFGVAFMFGLNIVQRMVGLGRNILVCRLMEPAELGRWNLAFSFLLLAAPLAVLGLPGVFGRYVEYYRHRGQLKNFLRRIVIATTVVAAVAVGLISIAPATIADWVFNDASQAPLIRTAVMVLAAVIAFNFLTELLTALRQVRLVSIMQFSHSFVFAVGAVGLLMVTSWGTEAVISAYAAGCLVATAITVPLVWKLWRELPAASTVEPASSMWQKLIPFATWIWATNILSNMYHVTDRYMLVHFATYDATDAAALVGQYHSSRVAPELLLAVAAMLSGVLLPYLANAWESGEKQNVWRYLTLALKVVALGFTLAGAGLLLVAPLLFDFVLGSKYHDGLEVLGPTIIYCIWTGLLALATTYLWCRERPVLGSTALLVGVVINVGMNLLLVPSFGLLGAVLATAIANAMALGLTYYFNNRLEMPISRSLCLLSGLPLILLGGAYFAIAAMLAVLVAAWQTSWLLTSEEKCLLRTGVASITARFA